MSNHSNRRKFLGTTAGAAVFTILPRRLLARSPEVPPSDKITLAYIGTGTQGLRELLPLLAAPEIRVVSVCDPSKHALGYRDWARDSLLREIRRALNKPDWRAGTEGTIPGGRDAAQNIVDTFYDSHGCTAYADYRELLDKEKDLNAVKIMTPDHLHGVASIAAMERGKHVIVHKPIANRLLEADRVIETARSTGVCTHFMPWDSNGSMDQVLAWIRDGSIGNLREIHNWTNRPVWPQYAAIPTGAPPVPEGFDWDLWLGPERERPYHPNYTHMVFRGWYDFGGGSMADMGHYSLWTVFRALDLSGPVVIEPMASHDQVLTDGIASGVKNDFSFPAASVVRFRYPARGDRGAVDLIWYEGGMRPPTPPEMEVDRMELPAEGMMFVGDKSKILAGFRVDDPQLIPDRRTARLPAAPPPPVRENGLRQWIAACQGGPQSEGSFLHAGGISEAVNLYAVALRSRRRLYYDAASRHITNVPEANKYLSREYRKGWNPE